MTIIEIEEDEACEACGEIDCTQPVCETCEEHEDDCDCDWERCYCGEYVDDCEPCEACGECVEDGENHELCDECGEHTADCEGNCQDDEEEEE